LHARWLANSSAATALINPQLKSTPPSEHRVSIEAEQQRVRVTSTPSMLRLAARRSQTTTMAAAAAAPSSARRGLAVTTRRPPSSLSSLLPRRHTTPLPAAATALLALRGRGGLPAATFPLQHARALSSAWVSPDAVPKGENLKKYSRNLTKEAMDGKLDPVRCVC